MIAVSEFLTPMIDPYGVLEEGQIHFRPSERIIDPESGTQMDIITGSVLVRTLIFCGVRSETLWIGVEEPHETALGRPEGKKNDYLVRMALSPATQVTAVSHPKLASYVDVIVFPVKGERSLASYLGGGG